MNYTFYEIFANLIQKREPVIPENQLARGIHQKHPGPGGRTLGGECGGPSLPHKWLEGPSPLNINKISEFHYKIDHISKTKNRRGRLLLKATKKATSEEGGYAMHVVLLGKPVKP